MSKNNNDQNTITQKSASPSRMDASLLGLVLLILFHFAQFAIWIHNDDRPPTSRTASHLIIAHDYKKLLAARDWKHLLYYDFKALQLPLPPVYHLSMLYAMDNSNPVRAVLWINFFYLALLCISLWGLGKRLLNGWAGVVAAILFSCAADIQLLIREVNLDMALIAWVAAAYWALFASNSFQHKGYSVLFGVLFAMSMLTKWSAFSYFLPLLILGASALSSRRSRIGVLLAAIISLCLIVPWYRAQWIFLLPRLIDNIFSQGGFAGVSLFSQMFYIRSMLYGLELPLFLAVVYALLFISRLRFRRGLPTLFFCFFGSLIFWMLLPRYDARFLLPGMIPLAFLVAGINSRSFRVFLCSFALLSTANFGFGLIPNVTFNVMSFPLTVFRSFPPAKEDWKIPKIIKEMLAMQDIKDVPENLAVVADYPRFNRATFTWELIRQGINTIRIRLPCQNIFEFSDYIMMKIATDIPESITVQSDLSGEFKILQESNVVPGWFQKGYIAMQRWKLPDGTNAVIFCTRRIFVPPFVERTALFNYYNEEQITGENMLVDLGEWDSARGVYRESSVKASMLSIGGLKAYNVHLIMEDLALMPTKKVEGIATTTSDLLLNVRFLHMRRLKILSGIVSEKDIQKRIIPEIQMTRLHMTDIKLGEKTKLKALLFNVVPVTAEITVNRRTDGRGVDMELQSSHVAGVPMPIGLLLGEHIRRTFFFDRDLPFQVEVASFTISGNRIIIQEPLKK